MNIDWDRIASEAEESPRVVLEAFLDWLDGVDTLIVIANRVDEDGNDSVRYESFGSTLKTEAIVGFASRSLRRLINRGEE